MSEAIYGQSQKKWQKGRRHRVGCIYEISILMKLDLLIFRDFQWITTAKWTPYIGPHYFFAHPNVHLCFTIWPKVQHVAGMPISKIVLMCRYCKCRCEYSLRDGPLMIMEGGTRAKSKKNFFTSYVLCPCKKKLTRGCPRKKIDQRMAKKNKI